jgi:hypothetical protein
MDNAEGSGGGGKPFPDALSERGSDPFLRSDENDTETVVAAAQGMDRPFDDHAWGMVASHRVNSDGYVR